MPDLITSIRSKLSQAELIFLKENFGVELRDPEVVAAISEMAENRAKILAIEERALRVLRERQGRTPSCSFCGATPYAVGPLAQSPRGPLICKSCAEHCISTVESSLRDGP
jgi:hypothetical protein